MLENQRVAAIDFKIKKRLLPALRDVTGYLLLEQPVESPGYQQKNQQHT